MYFFKSIIGYELFSSLVEKHISSPLQPSSCGSPPMPQQPVQYCLPAYNGKEAWFNSLLDWICQCRVLCKDSKDKLLPRTLPLFVQAISDVSASKLIKLVLSFSVGQSKETFRVFSAGNPWDGSIRRRLTNGAGAVWICRSCPTDSAHTTTWATRDGLL